MKWLCRSCEHRNTWWKGRCENCGTPLYGERPGPDNRPFDLESGLTMEDVKKILSEVPEPILPEPQQPKRFVDCGCPPMRICDSLTSRYTCPRLSGPLG